MVRVKICGITSLAAAVHAAQAGADAIGVVFYHKSPRYVSDLALARDIALAAGPFITVVGLFVDASEDDIHQVLDSVPLGMLQFHGDEQNRDCVKFRRPFIKALRMRPDLDLMEAVKAYPDASGMLLDAYKPGVPGGTGEIFDWSKIPANLGKPLVLAGGLNPDNVALAVSKVRPWAVDVSGGVEVSRDGIVGVSRDCIKSPGVKCPDLVERFIREAKQFPAHK